MYNSVDRHHIFRVEETYSLSWRELVYPTLCTAASPEKITNRSEVLSTLKMEAAHSFKMLVISYQSLWHHIPEDCSLNFHPREKLLSHT
jgi:hypothetical protein